MREQERGLNPQLAIEYSHRSAAQEHTVAYDLTGQSTTATGKGLEIGEASFAQLVGE